MSDPNPEQQELLAAARRGLSPSATDEARVLALVERALLVSVATPDTGKALGAETTGPFARPLLGKLGTSRLVAALALVGAAGGGYYAGFRAGARSTREPVNSALVVPSASALAASLSTSERQPTAEPGREASRVQSEQSRRAAKHGTPASSSAPSASRPLSLEEEVRTLRRVERALREQNPRLALALLSDLERDVPHGQLGEERFAAETLARCALGYGARQLLARDFLERYPASAYVTRVRQVCEGESDAQASPSEPEATEK